MKRLLILGVTLLATTALPVSTAHAQTTVSAQSIACASDVPATRSGHWYYRILDGRKCWYQGKPMMPKTSLHWPNSSGSAAEVAKPATDGRNVNAPAKPSTDGRNPSAPQPSAPTAWPAPAMDVMDDQSFESRWRGLKPDS
jgi:hypothetical protein